MGLSGSASRVQSPRDSIRIILRFRGLSVISAKGYWISNLHWNSVAGKPVDLSLFVTNLTKEKFFTNKLGGSSFSLDSGIVNEPRMFGARVRVRFGD